MLGLQRSQEPERQDSALWLRWLKADVQRTVQKQSFLSLFWNPKLPPTTRSRYTQGRWTWEGWGLAGLCSCSVNGKEKEEYLNSSKKTQGFVMLPWSPGCPKLPKTHTFQVKGSLQNTRISPKIFLTEPPQIQYDILSKVLACFFRQKRGTFKVIRNN